MVRSIFFAGLLVTAGLLITAFGARAASLDNTLYVDLKDGRVVIELRPDFGSQARPAHQEAREGGVL